jgi:ATP phosphoribosyltransferase regulatory subunit
MARVGNPLPQESTLKLTDRSGNMLVLRPDCTTPVARVAATKLSELPLPLRLYYDQTVYRSGAVNAGKSCEISQCGIELIGAEGLRADVEVVSMAVDVFKAVGAASFRLELGHRGFFLALASELALGAEETERLRRCIAEKNLTLLSDILGSRASPSAQALGRMPWLFGGAEVLDEAEGLTANRAALEAVSYLRRIYKALDSAGMSGHISFDLGLVQDLDYYTGIIFRGYAEGAGSSVLAGGRYDGLSKSFGREIPATGFAVYADSLAACLDGGPFQDTNTLVFYEEGRLAEALKLIDSLPEGSAELSHCALEAEAALNAAAKGASRLLVVSAGGIREVALK